MNTRVLLVGCLLALSVQAQESSRELWTWKDANGVVHYSDRPVPGAKKVELAGVTPSPSASAATATAPAAPAQRPRAPAAVQYQSLEIWQPAQDETFFGSDSVVTVRLRSEPGLAAGDRLIVALDGRRLEGPTNSYEYELANLPRGAHSLEAVIADEFGKTKIQSEKRVFHVRQASVNEPRAVGPSLKPAPPPKPAPKPSTPK